MLQLGPAILDVVADPIEDVVAGVFMARLIGEPDPIIGQQGVDGRREDSRLPHVEVPPEMPTFWGRPRGPDPPSFDALAETARPTRRNELGLLMSKWIISKSG